MADSEKLVPDQYFRALCQNPRCRKALGGFHIPCAGGVVMFACHGCNHVSMFRNEPFGIKPYLLNRKGEVERTAPPAK